MKFLKKIIPFMSLIAIHLTCVFPTQAEEIIIWHGLGGELEKHFQTLVNDFNHTLKEEGKNYTIKPVYKGKYEEVLETYLKTPADQRPDIAQIYEMGTRVMLEAKDPSGNLTYIPLHKVMEQTETPFDDNKIIPQLREFYRAGNPQLDCLPFNASTVVLYYNKTALDKAKLSPIQTFEEFTKQMETLKGQNLPVGLGSGWLSGHHIDQLGSRQNKRIATYGNGVESPDARLDLDPFFHDHLTALRDWHKKGWFSLEQGPDVEKSFAEQKIVYLSQGGNRHSDLQKGVNKKFEMGVASFPYWQGVGPAYNTIAGGAALWVSNKSQTPGRMTIIAAFLEFLVEPETQAKWQELTGYIPVSVGAHDINVKNGYFDSQELGIQAAKVAYESFTTGTPGEFTRGILLSNFPEIRKIEIEQMSEAIKGTITPKEAADQIAEKGNLLLKKDKTA